MNLTTNTQNTVERKIHLTKVFNDRLEHVSNAEFVLGSLRCIKSLLPGAVIQMAGDTVKIICYFGDVKIFERKTPLDKLLVKETKKALYEALLIARNMWEFSKLEKELLTV